MTISIEYESDISLNIDYETIIESVVLKALDIEECPYEVDLSIILTNNEDIQEINKMYRDIDAPTDVLSFPMIEFDMPSDFSGLEESVNDCFNPESGELLLGDIIISVEKVMDQAEEFGHSSKRELAFLVAHSMLHLFGYDHNDNTSDDDLIMERKQEYILKTLKIGR